MCAAVISAVIDFPERRTERARRGAHEGGSARGKGWGGKGVGGRSGWWDSRGGGDEVFRRLSVQLYQSKLQATRHTFRYDVIVRAKEKRFEKYSNKKLETKEHFLFPTKKE